MDAFTYTETDGGFFLEANGRAVLETHLKSVAEATIRNAYDEQRLQRVHDQSRALMAFARLRRLRPIA